VGVKKKKICKKKFEKKMSVLKKKKKFEKKMNGCKKKKNLKKK
jgi:hypothetical protein